MRILIPALFLLLYGFAVRAYWKSGRVPTFLWFEASRDNEPRAYWTFFGLAVGVLILGFGLFARALLFPETAKHLYRQDPLSTNEWIWIGSLMLLVCLIVSWELRNAYTRHLIAAIENIADNLEPDEEGRSLELVTCIYSWRDLRLLRSELNKRPKGYRRLVDAMKRVELTWPAE